MTPARERLKGATIAPYGPDVVLDTDGNGGGVVHYQDEDYPFTSYEDLLSRAWELPFTVELIRIYPDAEEECWQVKIGDKPEDSPAGRRIRENSHTLYVLWKALHALKKDDQEIRDVITSLVPGEMDELQLMLVETSAFLGWSEFTRESREAEAARFREEIEAEERAEQEAAEAAFAEPVGDIPDYAQVAAALEENEDAYPHIKVSVRWPDGGGESPWAMDLGNGIALMCNETLYPKYRFHDIFRFHGQHAGDVLFRPFPVKVVFIYEVHEDKETEQAHRKAMWEALQTLGHVKPGFFSPGNGYVLLPPGVEASAAKVALIGTGVSITDIKVQTFIVEDDEYHYADVE